ncbi:uncharacterized protein PV07_00414 [Cladophialophora immunda]|uniref:Major facilitator superfamily (MFS) profile domain-containing protein n=1 Tax=Cladophialophora immunda TaxID=569365 RepID=A0A0D1ZZM1_9EURO|nr:uncharacterized protein PV07_00414 [Cladophialophora immunda]KIW33576.1 hypothetical protein PV07_00414 [Cladophialophora immunda]
MDNSSSRPKSIDEFIENATELAHYSLSPPTPRTPKVNKSGITLVPQPSDDPCDPLNWSTAKKATTLAIVSLASFSALNQSLANAAGYFEQGEVYHKTPVEVSYGSSTALAGLAVGPYVFNPLAKRYGKCAMIAWGLVVNLCMNIWSACMTKFTQYDAYLASRFFASLAASAPTTVGADVIIETFFLHDRGKCFAIYSCLLLLGTTSGATFSGFIVQNVSWTVQFWYNVAFEAVLAVVLGFIVGLFLFITFGWAVVVTVELSVYLQYPVSEGGYGFTPYQYAYFSFAFWIGVFVAQLYGYLVNDRLPLWLCARKGGNWKPEYRLYALWFPALFISPPALGLVGASLKYHLHYMVLALGVVLQAFTAVAGTGICMSYLVECFTGQANEVAVALTLWRIGFGLALPFFIFHWSDEVGPGWTFGTMAFLNIVAFGGTVILMVWGHKIRQIGVISTKTEEDVKVVSGAVEAGQ